MKQYQHFINGEYVDPIGGQWIDTLDPYTGQPWARIPRGCAQDVDRAVQAASRAPDGVGSRGNRGLLADQRAEAATLSTSSFLARSRTWPTRT